MRTTTRTWLAAPALIAAIATAAGCGTEQAGQVVAGVTAAHLKSSVTETPQQRAEQDATAILAAFRPLPGATREGSSPVPLLAQPAEAPAVSTLATRTAWWLVPGQPLPAYAWLRAHPPAGFTFGGTGTAGSGYRKILPKHPSGVYEWTLTYGLPDVPGVLTGRQMVIQITAGGSGRTAIRVDAQSIWQPARTAAERIPATARAVTLTPVAGLNAAPAGDHPVTITDPAKVAAIAGAVDALPVFVPGTYGCPADTGRLLKMTFLASAGGSEVAAVSVGVTGCELVAVSVGGHALPELGGGLAGGQLAKRVLAIAGVSWPGF